MIQPYIIVNSINTFYPKSSFMTDHYWCSLSHNPSMELPKINLVSEAEILGIKCNSHAMPLSHEGIKTRSPSCIISQFWNSAPVCLGQVMWWPPQHWFQDANDAINKKPVPVLAPLSTLGKILGRWRARGTYQEVSVLSKLAGHFSESGFTHS